MHLKRFINQSKTQPNSSFGKPHGSEGYHWSSARLGISATLHGKIYYGLVIDLREWAEGRPGVSEIKYKCLSTLWNEIVEKVTRRGSWYKKYSYISGKLYIWRLKPLLIFHFFLLRNLLNPKSHLDHGVQYVATIRECSFHSVLSKHHIPRIHKSVFLQNNRLLARRLPSRLFHWTSFDNRSGHQCNVGTYEHAVIIIGVTAISKMCLFLVVATFFTTCVHVFEGYFTITTVPRVVPCRYFGSDDEKM